MSLCLCAAVIAVKRLTRRCSRTTLEVARDVYSTTYEKLSAAVLAANEQTWKFEGLVSSSMVQHMVAYLLRHSPLSLSLSHTRALCCS